MKMSSFDCCTERVDLINLINFINLINHTDHIYHTDQTDQTMSGRHVVDLRAEGAKVNRICAAKVDHIRAEGAKVNRVRSTDRKP